MNVTPLACLLALLLPATGLHAQAAWMSEIKPSSPGDFPHPPSSRLTYAVSWKGMLDAGSIELDFAPADHPKPGSYVMRSSSRSKGAASSLFPYEADFWSEIDPQSLRSRRFFATEKDRRETIETRATFHTGQAEILETTRNLKTNQSQSRQRGIRFTPVHDIFSAMLFTRSQPLRDGDVITLVVHPFATPYLVRIEVAGRHPHEGKAAIHLKVSMRKINRSTLQLEPYRKMKREASLWLSDDERRIPLEFRASVFIGDVRVTLKDHAAGS